VKHGALVIDQPALQLYNKEKLANKAILLDIKDTWPGIFACYTEGRKTHN
jgi:hypothetical protein